ncbi:MAG: class I SAM-dependent methyltransferase [Thiobacillus sp.]
MLLFPQRLPLSLQSLLIQLVACGGVAVMPGLGASLTLWQAALVQGVIAAGLSRLAQQPVWWQPLHMLFLPGVWAALHLSLSPAWYLLVFGVLASVYWSTFRTRVPLYLSDRRAWKAVEPFLPTERQFRFIDLGSGLGGVPLYLAPRFPGGQFFGTEVAPVPWLISQLRAWIKRLPVVFLRRDYTRLNLAEFDVVFAFLSPAAMPALWRKAQAEMRQGSRFISLSFTVDGRPPDREIALAEGARHRLYFWQM